MLGVAWDSPEHRYVCGGECPRSQCIGSGLGIRSSVPELVTMACASDSIGLRLGRSVSSAWAIAMVSRGAWFQLLEKRTRKLCDRFNFAMQAHRAMFRSAHGCALLATCLAAFWPAALGSQEGALAFVPTLHRIRLRVDTGLPASRRRRSQAASAAWRGDMGFSGRSLGSPRTARCVELA